MRSRTRGGLLAGCITIFRIESPDPGPGWRIDRMEHAQAARPARSGLTLTQQIFVGLGIGIVVGWFVSEYYPSAAPYFRPFSQIFLRLIKMIIAPLIFSTLVAGIAGAGHVKVVGRIGLRAIIYFEVVTTLALIIGLVTVNVMRPGLASTCRWASSRGSPRPRKRGI